MRFFLACSNPGSMRSAASKSRRAFLSPFPKFVLGLSDKSVE
jgi:hypothetical protein